MTNVYFANLAAIWKFTAFFFLFFFVCFVVVINFIVVYLHDALSNEVELFKIALVALYNAVCLLESAEQVDDHFVSKASLAFVKEVFKVPFKLVKNLSLLNEGSLHLGCQLLVERKLFNYEVEVMEKCFFDVASDIIV